MAFLDASSFGVVADGVTDNLAMLTSALRAMKELGGGVLYLPAGTILIGADPVGGYYGWTVDADNTVIQGHANGTTLMGHGDYASHGVLPVLVAKAGGTITGLEFRGITFSSDSTTAFPGTPSGNGAVTVPSNTTTVDLRIVGCSFDVKNLCGFTNSGTSTRLVLSGNIVTRVGEHGFYVAGTNDSPAVFGNSLLSVDSDAGGTIQTGISLKNCTSGWVAHNYVTGGWRNCGLSLADFNNNSTVVEDNTFIHLSYATVDGINWNRGASIAVRRNVFDDIGHSAIHASATAALTDAVITDNTFRNCVGSGRAITFQFGTVAPSNVEIGRNVCTQCTQGVEVDGAVGTVSVHDNRVTNTALTANPAFYLLNASHGTWTLTDNYSSGYSGNSIASQVTQSGNTFYTDLP